jgi:membrane associated rhomboid family serine protease
VYFFPYKIDRPFSMPWATIGLIAANVFVFVLQILGGFESTVMFLGFRPNLAGLITWVSAMFLHGGLMHLLGNMYFLWLFGSMVEDALGRTRYLAIYFAGGAAASLLHAVMVVAFMPALRDIPMVGASGAVAAIMGVAAMRFYATKLRVAYMIFFRFGTFAIPSAVGIGLWLAGQVLDGMVGIAVGGSGVANWAHVGGLVFGLAYAGLSGDLKAASREYLAEEADRLSAGATQHAAAAKFAELAESDPSNPEWHRKRARALANAEPPSLDAAREEYAAAYALAVGSRDMSAAFDIHAEAFVLCGSVARTSQELLALAAEAEHRFEPAEASRLYGMVLDFYGETPSAEKATFGLAHMQLRLQQHQLARETWARFVARYPYSDFIAFADAEFTRAT